MKVKEVVGGTPLTLQLRPLDVGWSSPPSKGDELQLVWSNDQILAPIGDDVVALVGASPTDAAEARALLACGLPFIAHVAKATDQLLVLEARRFPRELIIEEPIELGLDDRVIDTLRQKHRISGTVSDIGNWLQDRLFLPAAPGMPEDRLRLVVATDADERLETFRVFGHKLSAQVRRVGDRLRIERVTRGGSVGGRRLALLHVPVRIVDATRAAAVTGAARTALDEAVADGSSYL